MALDINNLEGNHLKVFATIEKEYLSRYPSGLRTAYAIQTPDLIGKEVSLSGWVSRLRDLGGVIFVILRDRTGEVQLTIDEKRNPDLFKLASKLSEEDVILARGKVARRPEENVNPKIPTGNVEILLEDLRVLARSEPLPYQKHQDVSEFLRLKYSYLELRTPRMVRNLTFRSLFTNSVRKFLISKGFLEVETPMLIRSTPEGARDFLVPSRLNPGKFYALPQSPQLLKQILMIGGIDKYFQIARCLRDEDLRADRQPEFTQIDIEMSFVRENDILSLVEEMFQTVFGELLGIQLKLPFPRITYHQAITQWGTDKPDIRYPYKLIDLTDIFRESEFKVLRSIVERGGEVIAFKLPVKLSRKRVDDLIQESIKSGITSHGFLTLELSDGKLKGKVAKFVSKERILDLASLSEGETLFIVGGERARELADSLKRFLVKKLDIQPESDFYFLWVVEFPIFKLGEDGRLEPHHHPFSMPYEEDVELIDSDPLNVRGYVYDLVLNGHEIGSGSLRITDPELQLKILEKIGYPREVSYKRFGFLLNAMKYGAPPHGGIALGLDRILAIILGESSIREVIAFPKTQGGICPLTDAPSEVETWQLDELGIALKG